MNLTCEEYLLQPVQSIIEFALAVESQQPNLLPLGTELVESWVSSRDLHGRLLLLLLLLLLLFACSCTERIFCKCNSMSNLYTSAFEREMKIFVQEEANTG